MKTPETSKTVAGLDARIEAEAKRCDAELGLSDELPHKPAAAEYETHEARLHDKSSIVREIRAQRDKPRLFRGDMVRPDLHVLYQQRWAVEHLERLEAEAKRQRGRLRRAFAVLIGWE